MDAVATELLKSGIPGVVILILLYACIRLWNDGKLDTRRYEEQARETAKRHEEKLAEIHNQRIADHQSMTNMLVRFTSENVAVSSQIASGLEAQKDALNELKIAFNDDTRRRPGR